MSRSLEMRVLVNPRADRIEVSLITFDGEIEPLGEVHTPSQLPALMQQVSAYIALHLVNAVWEAKSSQA